LKLVGGNRVELGIEVREERSGVSAIPSQFSWMPRLSEVCVIECDSADDMAGTKL
jgi:hypothetical protein